MNNPAEINWPDYNHPDNCSIHAKNELEMEASPENVWKWITAVNLWPSWYENSSNIKIIKGDSKVLGLHTIFRWKTFGSTITTKVVEFIPNERIAWKARIPGMNVYHAWVLVPSAKGCYVLTEETQRGWLAWLLKRFMPKRMHHFHQIWLEGLASKARTGPP